MHTDTPTSLRQAFSIIEVMIGIFIFSLWLVAIYALLISSLSLSEYNKNAIIASQLAVEQIEIVRNIRDTNYKTLRGWDSIPWSSSFSQWYYIVENDFSWNQIQITEIWSFVEGRDKLSDMDAYRLCMNDNGVYTFDCTSSNNTQTPFYRYLFIEEIWDSTLRLKSKVIWYSRWYHDYDITTLMTDWRRL